MKKEEKKITGDRIDLNGINLLMYGCFDPDYPSTKYMDAPEIEFMRSKVNGRRMGGGKIMITSTPAEKGDDSFEFYKQLWNEK